MIPGLTSKLSEEVVASAATITAKTDLIRLTGNTQVDTIRPNLGGGFSGILFIVPVDNTVVVSTTGNVAGAGSVTLLQNKVTCLVFSKGTGKWYTHALS
jgi:hypothetical protein